MFLILQWLLASLIVVGGGAFTVTYLRAVGDGARPVRVYLVWGVLVAGAWGHAALTAGAV